MNEVYEAIKDGAASHYEISITTGLSIKDIMVYTAKLEQQKFIFQLTHKNFVTTSKLYNYAQ